MVCLGGSGEFEGKGCAGFMHSRIECTLGGCVKIREYRGGRGNEGLRVLGGGGGGGDLGGYLMVWCLGWNVNVVERDCVMGECGGLGGRGYWTDVVYLYMSRTLVTYVRIRIHDVLRREYCRMYLLTESTLGERLDTVVYECIHKIFGGVSEIILLFGADVTVLSMRRQYGDGDGRDGLDEGSGEGDVSMGIIGGGTDGGMVGRDISILMTDTCDSCGFDHWLELLDGLNKGGRVVEERERLDYGDGDVYMIAEDCVIW
ncbi:hypothetical protein Tco_0168016 [Tanacetum coccineum]